MVQEGLERLMDRIVLAYSGGLDTSVAIPWLAEKYGAEIVTVTMDLGQGKELDDARERALALGAVRAHVLDLRNEFARDFVLPALQAGAVYEQRYPLATALGRPLIARHLVEIARLENASVVAHGCGTEKGNDAIRIDLAVRALNPDLEVLEPLGVWDVTKQEKVAFAKKRGIPVPAGADSPYTTDVNLWGRSIEYGVLDDPWLEPPDDVYVLTRAPKDAPDLPAYVEIEFERGVPVAINGVTLSLVELISSLETIAGVHGVGRIDLLENRLGDTKSREIYEAPAGVLLHAAHNELQKYVTPRDLARLASEVGVRYADLVYNGDWYSHTREAMDALVAKVQERVTGAIRLKLFKGDHRVVGRTSPFGLYDQDRIAQSADTRPSLELRP
ncbi:MAG: argininosuccinate synthase [Acidobacteria bacterium SCN 69-37]|nr:MAG: argininosuccinate synthase [Acidobacteria bacterium SCN 69-37]